MKNIIVVVSDENLGGVTTSLVNFCNELCQHGHNVTLLNMGEKKLQVEARIARKVTQINLNGLSKEWQLGWNDIKKASFKEKMKLIPLAIVKKLTNRSELWLQFVFKNYVCTEEYDVAIAFRQCAPCYYFVLNCLNAMKKIAFIHGNLKDMGDISSFDCYFDKFDYISCVSSACADGFKNAYPLLVNKFTYVYNMFPAEEIRQKAKESSNIQIDSSVFNIITVSRIENATKGIDRIPLVCKLLKDEKVNFQWYILGDGPDMEANKNLAEQLDVDNVVKFCGAIENPHPLVQQANLSVLPTYGEAYSMTVIESFIVGTPILITEYPGVEEAVEQNITGFIVSQNEYEIAEKIKEIILNPNILSQMREKLLSDYKHNNGYEQFVKLI